MYITVLISSLQVRHSATTMRKRKGKLFNDEELEKLKTKCNVIIEMRPITEGNSWSRETEAFKFHTAKNEVKV